VRGSTIVRVWIPVAVFVAVCVGIASVYVARAPRHARATAKLLVTPVARNDARYAGLPVLRSPTAVGDAAQLAGSSTLAEAVRERLGLQENAADVLAHMDVGAVPASSVVQIASHASDPGFAVRLANGFADELVAQRTATLKSAIADATTRTFDQLVALSPTAKAGAEGAALRERLAQLRSLSRTSDPSLRVISPALAGEEEKPKAALILLGTLGGALLLGILAGLLATRRRSRGREYDLAVTERVVAELEQRLAERIEALLAEQERLAAREAELAERERALLAGDSERDVRSRGLDERLKLLTSRELELVKRAGALAAREKELGEREGRLGPREQQIASRDQELRAYAQELSLLARDVDDRRAELEARVAEVEARVAELDRRAAELDTRTVELDARGRQLEARSDELSGRAAELEERAAAPPPWQPVAAVPPPPPPAENVREFPQRPGQWNLNELQRLVEQRGEAYPERHDEWQSYLFFLRSYAEPDGAVPASFDWLIEEQFGMLMRNEPGASVS
jgi:capsular polysaccharide biosynthesis protein